MIVLPNMGLVKWDSINDYFSHEQLAANFQSLDEHNHTAGKGKPIAYGGLAEQSVGPENLREGILYPAQIYEVLAEQSVAFVSGSSPGGTWFGGKLLNTSNLTEVTNPPQNGFCYINPTEYTITGKTTKFRVVTTLLTNGTAPATTFRPGLFKITTPNGTSGVLHAASEEVAGSRSTLENPAKESIYVSTVSGSIVTETSKDFEVKNSGLYGIGIQNFAGPATGSAIWAISNLTVHYV